MDNPVAGWRSLFWIASCVHVVGAIAFGVFGTTDEQEWAKSKSDWKNEDKARRYMTKCRIGYMIILHQLHIDMNK